MWRLLALLKSTVTSQAPQTQNIAVPKPYIEANNNSSNIRARPPPKNPQDMLEAILDDGLEQHTNPERDVIKPHTAGQYPALSGLSWPGMGFWRGIVISGSSMVLTERERVGLRGSLGHVDNFLLVRLNLIFGGF